MNRRNFYLSALALAGAAAAGTWAVAAETKGAALDPAQAGPDYLVQGEYLGTLKGGRRVGAQVIALGNGTFQAVFLPGGLPRDGWDGQTRIRVDGKTEGSETRFGKPGGGWNGSVMANSLQGETDRGERFELKKVVRQSNTLGMKPPAGAVVLFDGTNADAWQNGKVEDGLLRCGTRTKQSFQDFTLHLEFRTPFVPLARGQARGNSGLYLQDRYEIQILDSFGLDGKDNECGGIYRQSAPSQNMCLPPLSWQTYDIDFETARFDADGKKIKDAVVSVRHNGMYIHDRLHLSSVTPGGGKNREDATGGPFQLQDHGNPVYVRNVWVVEKK